MEGFPLRLSLSLMLAAAVVGISFYMLLQFQAAAEKKGFADDISEIVLAMESTAKTGDYGSFTRVNVKIPNGCEINFNTNGELQIKFFGDVPYNYPDKKWMNILWGKTFGPGTYEIPLIYAKDSSHPKNCNQQPRPTGCDENSIGYN